MKVFRLLLLLKCVHSLNNYGCYSAGVTEWRSTGYMQPVDKFYPARRQEKKVKTVIIIRFSVVIYHFCSLVFICNLMAREQIQNF